MWILGLKEIRTFTICSNKLYSSLRVKGFLQIGGNSYSFVSFSIYYN